jgi:hypothetical protein
VVAPGTDAHEQAAGGAFPSEVLMGLQDILQRVHAGVSAATICGAGELLAPRAIAAHNATVRAPLFLHRRPPNQCEISFRSPNVDKLELFAFIQQQTVRHGTAVSIMSISFHCLSTVRLSLAPLLAKSRLISSNYTNIVHAFWA